VRRLALLLPGVLLGVTVACTVDEVVGSNVRADGGTDAGTPICPSSGPGTCDPVCGDQICRTGCTDIHDCETSGCSGSTCTFRCERGTQACSPGCDPGACSISCIPSGENYDCTVSCNPLQTCAVECRGGTCTVACGNLTPATTCDAGVYSCTGACPP